MAHALVMTALFTLKRPQRVTKFKLNLDSPEEMKKALGKLIDQKSHAKCGRGSWSI